MTKRVGALKDVAVERESQTLGWGSARKGSDFRLATVGCTITHEMHSNVIESRCRQLILKNFVPTYTIVKNTEEKRRVLGYYVRYIVVMRWL